MNLRGWISNGRNDGTNDEYDFTKNGRGKEFWRSEYDEELTAEEQRNNAVDSYNSGWSTYAEMQEEFKRIREAD